LYFRDPIQEQRIENRVPEPQNYYRVSRIREKWVFAGLHRVLNILLKKNKLLKLDSKPCVFL